MILNVAVVGYGMAGRVLHAPLVRATEGLRLHAIVSSRPHDVSADLPDVAVVSDLDAILANPEIDLVVLATPDHLHAPQAIAALRAGKAVVVDKPFALGLEEARSVATVATETGSVLSVFQNRRWDGDFLTLRRLIDEGRLGEVVEVQSWYNRLRPTVRDIWKERRAAGVWQDLGPHLVDQMLQLFGSPIAVYADLATQKANGPGGDCVHAVLRYPCLRAVLHASQMTADPGPRWRVHGTKGSWVKHGLDTQETALNLGQRPGGPGWGVESQPGTLTLIEGDIAAPAQPLPGIAGNYLAYYAAMRDAVRGCAPNPVTVEQALETMRVIEAGKRSAAERREVSLSEI